MESLLPPCSLLRVHVRARVLVPLLDACFHAHFRVPLYPLAHLPAHVHELLLVWLLLLHAEFLVVVAVVVLSVVVVVVPESLLLPLLVEWMEWGLPPLLPQPR